MKDFWTISRDLGVDSKEVVFEEVPSNVINRLAAQLLPYVPQHWSRGRSYIKQRSRHDLGGRIYEIVFNLDPARAYIGEDYSEPFKALTVPHVLGHGHIFKHSIHERSDVKNLDSLLRSYVERVEAYNNDHGIAAVEEAIDLALALASSSHRRKSHNRLPSQEGDLGDYDLLISEVFAQEPEGQYAAQKVRAAKLSSDHSWRSVYGDTILQSLDTDLVHFFLERSLFPEWVNDILRMEYLIYDHTHLRDTTLSFVHEGFASWTHTKVLPKTPVPDDWRVDFALLSARVTAPFWIHPYQDLDGESYARIEPNPYGVGLLLMRYMEVLGRDVPKEVTEVNDYSLFSRYSNPDFWFNFVRKYAPPSFDHHGPTSLLLPDTGEHEDFFKIYSGFLRKFNENGADFGSLWKYLHAAIYDAYHLGAGWYYLFLLDLSGFMIANEYDPYNPEDLEEALFRYLTYFIPYWEPPLVYALELPSTLGYRYVFQAIPAWRNLVSTSSISQDEAHRYSLFLHFPPKHPGSLGLPSDRDVRLLYFNSSLESRVELLASSSSFWDRLEPRLSSDDFSVPQGIVLTSAENLDLDYAIGVGLMIRKHMSMTREGAFTDLVIILSNPIHELGLRR